MATPVLRAAREQFGPDSKMVGVLRPYVVDVLAGTGWLNEHVLFDRHHSDTRLHTRSVIQRMRELELDMVLLLTNSLRAAAMARLASVPRRVGYVRYGRGFLLTDRLYPPRRAFRLQPVSAVDYYRRLADRAGISTRTSQLTLATTQQDETQADRIFQRYGLEGQRPIITLNTGGAYGSAKQWPTEYYAALSRRLVEELQAHVLIICGPAERETARKVESLAGTTHVRSMAEEHVSIGLSKAIVRRSELLISTDSGPRHFGAAFQVPTITLFGPTDPRWSENYHDDAVHLQRDIACGPCAKRQCPLIHHRCMRELTADHVFHTARNLLERKRARHAA